MIRTIIHIDQDKCIGCGLCADACHEGAIGMVEGKARLLREDYCDGLGDCLPACPAGAITFEEREAPAYDAVAVAAAKIKKASEGLTPDPEAAGCPGARAQALSPVQTDEEQASQLRNWPVQIKLAPVQAPFYQGASLLIAADCTAYAYAAFHRDFLRGRVALIGCPKLDGVDYGEKLGRIIALNDVEEVTLLRMEVPCCGGLENAARQALQASGKDLPCRVVTIAADGRILE